jgi:hypothetical protein
MSFIGEEVLLEEELIGVECLPVDRQGMGME